MLITSGKNPNILNRILNGEKNGTLFVSKKEIYENEREYLISKIDKE